MKSNGKLKLELSKSTFDFFSNEVKIDKARISDTGKSNAGITYNISFQKVTITTNSLLSAFFSNSLEVRKIKLYDPVVEVFNWQKDSISAKNTLSLGLELGKLYHSIDDAITDLNTHSISLSNATLILNDKTEPGKRPLIFSNIYFTLKKLNKHKNPIGKYLDNNDILFSSSNQNITFTDGIHKLLFKRLVIQHAKNIILDSCTIIASPTPVFLNGYNIQFKRLALIGVDFDALYKTNVIRADSVYCESPFSNINLTRAVRHSNLIGKGIPDLEKIIKEFSGDLDLGFVGVMNADIHLNIANNKTQSNFHSGKVNFQIKNLRINPDSSRIISMKSFDMLVKGYQLYNADSSCVYSFDSVRFANDKLLLNNFSAHTSSGINKIRSFRDYNVPYFELLGLDWPELIFNQNLKANKAILHDPVITYKKVAKVELSKKSMLFNTHRSLENIMDIDQVQIINGQININWGKENTLQLNGLDLSGNNLVDYKHIRLQKDIDFLFFKNGFLKVGSIIARLQNVNFKTNNEIHADHLLINFNTAGIDSRIDDVSLKNIYTEENKDEIVIDGLQWEQGTIIINSMPGNKKISKRNSILIKNISGKQTQFKYINQGIGSNAFIDEAIISTVLKNNGEPAEVKGLKLKGRKMSFLNSSIRMNADIFNLSDNSQEFLGSLLEKFGYGTTLVANLPSILLTNNINSFFTNDFHFKNISLTSPVIDFKKQDNTSLTGHKISPAPAIKIDHMTMVEPVMNAEIKQDVEDKKFSLPYSKGSEIKADNVEIAPEEIRLASLSLTTQKAEITGIAKDLKIDKWINLNLSDINIATGSPSWIAKIANLDLKNSTDFAFTIKDNKLELKDVSLGDCMISFSSIKSISKLLTANPAAWVSTSEVKYSTKNSLWQSFNVSYKMTGNLLTLDSLNYYPSLPRDSFIAARHYQTDYIKFSAGNTKLYGFDVIKYLNEASLSIQKAGITKPSIIDFRDKLLPFLAGVRKQFFTEMIKKINLPLSIGQIDINDGNVSYKEKNGDNRLEGTLILAHLNGNVFNIKNHQIDRNDSLSLLFKGKLLDEVNFNLKLNQSYTDPFYGFSIALRIDPVNLTFLNPLLAPLSNVKVTSGTLNKFEMNATGNENFAKGEMKFYYHGLRIRLLKNGGIQKSTFIKPTESVLVNTFFVKNNNGKRTGLIYFKRVKDRSFFNYMNKIIFSGITTSVGANKNNRYRKEMSRDTPAK